MLFDRAEAMILEECRRTVDKRAARATEAGDMPSAFADMLRAGDG